jgi:hypothetical protein
MDNIVPLTIGFMLGLAVMYAWGYDHEGDE